MQQATQTLVICGGGLAGHMCAAKLARSTHATSRIVHISPDAMPDSDVLYGSVTTPTAYGFLQSMGLDEPTLFMRSATTFSLGTYYKNWPKNRSWLQTHHLPLPQIGGVPLQHHLTYRQAQLSPLLVSVQAAQRGVFAHPPEDPRLPLSRAEYGYQFSPAEWAQLLAQMMEASRVEQVCSDIASANVENGRIVSVTLSNGAIITGDMFIDATGPSRKLISQLGAEFEGKSSLTFSGASRKDESTGPPYRVVEADASGWQSMSHLQEQRQVLSVRSAASGADGHAIETGCLDHAWVGNCVALGQSACLIEPVTPAPLILLQRDIERFLDLLPVTKDARVERREYNRRFKEDVSHAELFHNAMFMTQEVPDADYWQDAANHAQSPKLARKLDQFESRGLLVKYDLEPFNDEDWLILHHGMQRRAARYDAQVENISAADIDRQLHGLQRAIEQMVARMPPHHIYIANMKRYFEKQGYA